jgi:choline dehydrogenase-like flavoprotein
MTTDFDCLVIGSGPSGVAAASALLAAGRSVTMVDPGLELEPARADMVAAARAQGPLSPANAPWLKEPATPRRVPRKLIYGSDFPYRDAAQHFALDAEGVGAEPSFARAGLSNVWGAAALPYTAHDTADWPVGESELAPHYAACAELLGLAGEEDDLADWLPLHAPPRGQLRASRQGATMLDAMNRHRDALNAQGLRFGRARVAANAAACIYCGLCLHGCPDKLVWSANDTLAALVHNPRFRLRGDVIIDTLAENADAAHARGVNRLTDAPIAFSSRQIFLAAGAIPTTAILLRSADAYDETVALKDSQYFLLPLALFRGARGAAREKLHTMAQLFLELRDATISPCTIHMQIYTYNALMARAMRQRLGPLRPLARLGDAYFVLIQGYLHSAHSGAIDITLRHDRLEARGRANPEARRVIAALVRKLMRVSTLLGAVPLAPLMEITEPGRGFHIGGSFPMRAEPGRFDTDTQGRPLGWTRIHAVDATVLPSVPATTITYPVMANAHRIATEAAKAFA